MDCVLQKVLEDRSEYGDDAGSEGADDSHHDDVGNVVIDEQGGGQFALVSFKKAAYSLFRFTVLVGRFERGNLSPYSMFVW